jgi:hypothetical protein
MSGCPGVAEYLYIGLAGVLLGGMEYRPKDDTF